MKTCLNFSNLTDDEASLIISSLCYFSYYKKERIEEINSYIIDGLGREDDDYYISSYQGDIDNIARLIKKIQGR